MDKKTKTLLSIVIIFIMVSMAWISVNEGAQQNTTIVSANSPALSPNINNPNNGIYRYNFGFIHSNIYQYNSGNEKVIFHGNQVSIGFGKNTYRVKWNVMTVAKSGLSNINFSAYKINRIKNNYQNSAVMISNNSMVKVAEIFTFKKDAIDASMAIKNLNKGNTTYIVVFELETKHHNIAYLHGNNAIKLNMHGSSNSKVINRLIPSGNSGLSMGHVKVGWQSDISLFHLGVLSTNSMESKASLPFGPIKLASNETYTVDPSIKPAVAHICACSGGGGGGGGSSSTPPTLSSFKIATSYDNTIQGKTQIKMTADVSSLGSGPDVLKMCVFNNMTNQLQQFYYKDISSTGQYTATWSAVPGSYCNFNANVYNSQTGCGESTSAGHHFNVYTEFPYSGENGKCYPGQTYKSSPVYNTSGDLVGYLTLQMTTNANFPVHSDCYQIMHLTTSFMRINSNSNYYVNSVYQNFKWTGDQINTPPSNYWVKSIVCSESCQNYQNGTWQVAEESLYAALTVLVTSESLGAGAIMAALYPVFFHQISTSLPTGRNDINISHNAGYYYSGLSTCFFYYSLGYSYDYDLHFRDSYVFEFKQEMKFQGSISNGYTSSNAMLNYFDYSAGYGITNGGQGLFYGTVSEPIYIAEY